MDTEHKIKVNLVPQNTHTGHTITPLYFHFMEMKHTHTHKIILVNFVNESRKRKDMKTGAN